MDELKRRAYEQEQEVKRMHDPYATSAAGADMKTPYSPIGASPTMLGGPPVMPTDGRLAQLCKQVADAGQALTAARARFNEARGQREHIEGVFANLVEELLSTINEHREGAPENAPYPR